MATSPLAEMICTRSSSRSSQEMDLTSEVNSKGFASCRSALSNTKTERSLQTRIRWSEYSAGCTRKDASSRILKPVISEGVWLTKETSGLLPSCGKRRL